MRGSKLLALASTLGLALALVPGCAEDELAPAQAILLEARLERGAQAAACQEAGPLFTTGDPGNPNVDPSKPGNEAPNIPPKPTVNGENSTDVVCTVRPIGPDEFEVSAFLAARLGDGGTFQISGKLKPGIENKGLSVTMAKRGLPAYRQNNGCTVVFAERGQTVAPGRMWGTVTCPLMEHSGNANEPCQGSANFKFENCGQ